MTTAKKLLTADFALISHERIQEPLPRRRYVAGLIPDLLVEVISPQRFGVSHTLTSDPVLPGFACPVADIFAY